MAPAGGRRCRPAHRSRPPPCRRGSAGPAASDTAIDVNRLSSVAPGQQGADGGAVQVEPVAVDQHVDAGPVPAPHLEPVDGGQRDLDGQVGLDGGGPGAGPARSATARAVRSRSTRMAHTTSLRATSAALSPSTSETPSTPSASRASSMRTTARSSRSLCRSSPIMFGSASTHRHAGAAPQGLVDGLEPLHRPTQGGGDPKVGSVEVAAGRGELVQNPVGFGAGADAPGGAGLRRCRTRPRG